MAFQIIEKEMIKLLMKLYTTLDNDSVKFPITVYVAAIEREVAAFMDGSDRELLVSMENGRPVAKMSDDKGAREKWEQREREVAMNALEMFKGLAGKNQGPMKLIIAEIR